MISGTGSGCSALSYVTTDQTTVGIVAFDDPDSGGSHYFVGVMDAAAQPSNTEGDCAGREPPGVPKPARSTRTLSIENLGGVASVVNLYDAWGRPSEIVESVRDGMSRNRWLERADSSAVLSSHYPGHSLLSFSRGHEQCLVGVDQDQKTGKILVVLFWAERPWLPKDVAL